MAQHGENSANTAGRDHTGSLGPELWAEIMRRVPVSDRVFYVPLVSRRFSEVCRDPSVWPELQVLHRDFRTEAHWRSFLRWLAVRAPGLQSFMLVDEKYEVSAYRARPWGRRTRELVALLAASAPRLQSLGHGYPVQAPADPASVLPADLGRLSQLTSLCLHFGSAPVTTAQVDAMVQTLPSLQHLTLEDRIRGTTLADVIPASIATSCIQLESLEIIGCQRGAVPPELGRLTALTYLRLYDAGVTSLPDSISRLTALRELKVHDWQKLDGSLLPVLALPPALTACWQLTKLAMDSDSASPVLARLQSLRSLMVRYSPHQLPYNTHWTQLTALTELRLLCEYHRSIPARLQGMIGLRKLSIYNAYLNLPAGPYLSRLEELRLIECTFQTGVPDCLAAATQLRSLHIIECSGMALSAADVAVLSSLPSLTALTMLPSDDGEQPLSEEGLAQLEAACTARGCVMSLLSEDSEYQSYF